MKDLMEFIDKSPTPWHAVREAQHSLEKAGFKELHELDSWDLKPGHRYFVTREGTSICAFATPLESPQRCVIAAAHTDSPGFKLKPQAEYREQEMVMLGLEIYGGPLLTSWLNRELGIAGRVIVKCGEKICEQLVALDLSATIPQLAIHLDRNVNENGLALHKQDHLAALAGTVTENEDKNVLFLEQAIKRSVGDGDVLGADLFVYPLEPLKVSGIDGSLLSGYRLDNLCSLHAALMGLIRSSKEVAANTVKMSIFWDHEEIGSSTVQGAGSPFLSQVLERIAGSRENYFRLQSQSLCVSIDVGHALHPNYQDKHEPHHQLLLNRGIIIKNSAQYKYATNAKSAAVIQDMCRQYKIPLQQFVSRGNISSGTTIGPVAASLTGIPTVDIGISMLSMHSCREIIGVKDQKYLNRLLEHLFEA